jgi:hypothetical protein
MFIEQDEFELCPKILDLGALASLLKRGDYKEILTSEESVRMLLTDYLRRIQAKKKLSQNKENFRSIVGDIQTIKIKLSSVYSNFANKTFEIKEAINNKLANPEGKKLNNHEILSYASRISANIQAPRDYRVDDKFLPMSVGLNKISMNEIDSSILNYRYKQNKNYKKCQMPFIKPLNDTEKNIMKNFRGNLRVKNFLYLQALPSDDDIVKKLDSNPVPPRVIYTSDGSNPTLHNFIDSTTDLIYISKDTVLKFRTIRHGYIDSKILEVAIQVEEAGEGAQFSPQNMVRPNFNNFETEGSVENVDFNEDLFFNTNFVSWNESGNYSTPRD